MMLPPARLARWIASAMRRELAGAFLLTLALSLGNFAVPHVMQCKLFAIDIYMRMSNYLDPVGALSAAFPLLLVTLAAALLFGWFEPNSSTLPATDRPHVIRLGRWKAPIVLALTGGWLLTAGLPIAGLVASCGSLAHFLEAASAATEEAETTLMVGLATAFVATLAAAIVLAGHSRCNSPLRDALLIAPIGIPALVIALAYSRFYNQSSPVDLTWVGNTSLLVILGLSFRAWPFAVKIIGNGQSQVPTKWLEAADLAGVPWRQRLTQLHLPLLGESVVSAALLAFVISVGEVEISQLLCAPGEGTLALRLFTFLHFGPTHISASLALLQLGIAAVPTALFCLIFNRRPAIV